MKKDPSENPGRTVALLFPVVGALALAALSIPQKLALGADPFTPSGFVVPIVFGAVAGAVLAFVHLRSRRLLIEKLTTEQDFEDRNRLLQDLVATIPGIVYQFRIDAHGVPAFPYISPTVKAITGVDADAILRDPEALFGILPPEDRPDLERSIQESYATLSPWIWVGRGRTPGGKTTWFRGASVPRRLDDGSVLWNGALFDITDLKEAKADLHAANERLEERIVERTRELDFQKRALDEHAIVSVTDAKGTITYANDKFCQISGYTRDELIGKNHSMLKSGHHGPDFYGELWETITRGRVWHGDIMNKTKAGAPYWVRASIVPFLDDRGKPFQYVAIRTDITERKKVEAELEAAKAVAEKAQADAEAANQAKSMFLSSMSHELRTPLNAIFGFGQLLTVSEDDVSKGTLKEYVGYILDAGTHLLNLINQVLDLAKIESGTLELTPETFSPRDGVVAPIAMAKAMADKKAITVTNLCGGKALPNVIADPVRFRQILLNFLSNAIKYNREYGEVTIECRTVDERYLRFLISDTGFGIPADQYPNLFQPFQRLGKEKTAEDGTGIGLAISRELVAKMGGALGFESEVGEGSTFWFDLPVAPAAPAAGAGDAGALEAAGGGAPDAAPGLGVTVLYIEDHPVNVALMKKILDTVDGMKMISAGTAEEGLAVIEASRPSLVLMDINLPGLSGGDACKILKENAATARIPVIAVSAHAMRHDRDKAPQFGFDGYIAKPFQIGELMDAISAALNAK